MPPHEVMEVAVSLDDVGARPQPKVKGVTEDNLGTNLDNIPRQHAFDRAVSADRHECGGLHRASREIDLATSGQSILMGYLKLHQPLRSLVRNIASP